MPEPTDELPDAYENEEHVNTLRNVAAVSAESPRLREPYEAWVE